MWEVNGRIRWLPRVSQAKIRQLYEADARGIVDAEEIAAIGFAFLDRCRDMLTVARAHAGKATCPSCTAIVRHDWDREAELRCACGWHSTWGAYLATCQKRELMPGGAEPSVEAFVREFPAAKSSREKMLIDRLIHRFHWGSGHPQHDERGTGRVVAAKLIEGRSRDLLRFLDGLSGIRSHDDPGRAEVAAAYRSERARSGWVRHGR